MLAYGQSVIKNIHEVTLRVPKKISLYIALMIKTSDRKNYASMAYSNGISYNKVYVKDRDAAKLVKECVEFLHSLVKQAAQNKEGFLIFDFSKIPKPFSEHIPSVTYDYDGVSKRVEKGFSTGFITWSDGKIAIPFDFSWWLRKKDLGELYKKKSELAKELIIRAKQQDIPFKEARMDGAFASEDMLKFLISENIHFTFRIAKNRVIKTKNYECSLAKHPDLRLTRNQKYKTIKGWYKGIEAYFTAHKRKTKNGEYEVVFIISDIERSPKNHVLAYKQRWPSEKYHRTAKQHLGLADNQSTNADKQRLHVFSVMISYAILELIRIDKKKQSVEEILHQIRRQKLTGILSRFIDLEQTFMS
jgi:hypothetical protein